MLKKQTTLNNKSEYDSLLDNQSVNYKGSLKQQETFISQGSDEPKSA